MSTIFSTALRISSLLVILVELLFIMDHQDRVELHVAISRLCMIKTSIVLDAGIKDKSTSFVSCSKKTVGFSILILYNIVKLQTCNSWPSRA